MPIEGDIRSEQEFRHIKSGGVYTVLFGTHDNDAAHTPNHTLVKIGVPGIEDDTTVDHPGWMPCVIYYDPSRPEHNFVRDEASFREKFERV